MKTLTHSCPIWILGKRKAHPKFGGDVVLNGIGPVRDRLMLIKSAFPNDLTSGHIFHEICTTMGAYVGWNNPDAIPWNELVKGITDDKLPQIAALTVPAFGWKGVENGALLSEDPTIVQMVMTAHVDAIVKTKWLKKNGLGRGICIWWPAFDSERMNHGNPRKNELTREQAFELLISRWVDICRDALGALKKEGIDVPDNEPLIWLEYKPRVPGKDYISTLALAIKFVSELCKRLGRRAAALNNEWAHLLLGGTTVEDGTKQTIEAGDFTGFFHANSAELAEVTWDTDGNITDGTTGEDYDWHVGAGGSARWEDQQKGVKAMFATDLNIIAEHDIDPSGDDPMGYYGTSRSNLIEMFAAAGWPSAN